MKFEFVEFYPSNEKNRKKHDSPNLLGTVHIYLIDFQIDLRGIRVLKSGNKIFFFIPHIQTHDHETGEKVRYPVFRLNNQKNHDEMMKFLHNDVKQLIFHRLNDQG